MHSETRHTARKKRAVEKVIVLPRTARETGTIVPDCKNEKPKYIRKSRAKRCIGWDNYIATTHSASVNRIQPIARCFPELTPHQLRIAALVADQLPSYEIAKILGVKENAVNKVRCRMRKGIAIKEGAPLAAFLLAKTA
jgi:hypothetical protein